MVSLSFVAIAVLVGCGAGSETLPQNIGFDGSGPTIAGEFAIQRNLNDRELRDLGLEQLRWNESLGWGLYLANNGVSVSAITRALQQSRGILVESNRPVAAFATNDPYREFQWDMTEFQVEAAWQQTTGRGIRVAVIDTGLGKSGEDRPKNVATGYDFVDDDNDPSDLNGHGTHVSGTIAQATHNGLGTVGVAPDAEILPLRVLDADGSGDAYATAEAIAFAADHGAEVINLSLGSSSGTSVERDAVNYAIGKGVVICAATGNESANAVSYPAAYDGVIAVGATRFDKSVASYSNGGSSIDLVAPGGDMAVDQNNDGYGDGILQEVTPGSYEFYEGTSMATPHIAGAVALLMAAGAEPVDVFGLLTGTATDVGAPGFDTRSGYGLVQPIKALQALESGHVTEAEPGPPPDTTPPAISDVWAQQSGTTLAIGWTTDEPASSHIEFQDAGAFGDDHLVTEHELRFTVTANVTYNFTVLSTDAAGNESTDGVYRSR